MQQIPWFAWIPLAAILGWIITDIFETLTKMRRATLKAELGAPQRALLAESTEVNRALVERLDQIDGRLGAIEKTLTDIP